MPANINYRYLDDELRELLVQAEAKVLVHHASLVDRVQSATSDLPDLRLVVEVDDLAAPQPLAPGTQNYEAVPTSCAPSPRIDRPGNDVFLSFTGGTTGLPKGVEYLIDNSVRNTAVLSRLMLGLEDLDWTGPSIDRALAMRAFHRAPVALPASPMMHSAGLIMASLPVLTLGGTVVTLTSQRFDADELFRTIAVHRPSTVSIVGDAFARPMLRALDHQAATGAPYDTSSLVTVTSAGVAWSGQVKEAMLEHMPQVTLVDSCGSTEGATIGSQVTRLGQDASTERFAPAPGLRIVRPDGEVIAPDSDELGQFLVPTVARGYRNDPRRTAATFQTIDGQGYVLPGDWGRWNVDGTVTLFGRGTGTINTGGEKVFPEEIQKIILLQEGVEDCLVFGVADERFGQRVVAIVQPIAGREVDPDSVIEFVHGRLAGYKTPKAVLDETVPRAANGKVIYTAARELFADRMGAGWPRYC